MIVLGYDPGAATGWSVVDCSKPAAPRLVSFGVADGAPEELPVGAIGLVAVETVVSVYSRERFGAGMATALVNAARIEGRIIEMAKRAGIAVVQCTAGDWRKALTGKRAPSDAEVKARLGLRLALPRCSAHVRDAVGVAIYCAERRRLEAIYCAERRRLEAMRGVT